MFDFEFLEKLFRRNPDPGSRSITLSMIDFTISLGHVPKI